VCRQNVDDLFGQRTCSSLLVLWRPVRQLAVGSFFQLSLHSDSAMLGVEHDGSLKVLGHCHHEGSDLIERGRLSLIDPGGEDSCRVASAIRAEVETLKLTLAS
jgi:hypothetical protein